MRDTVDQAHGAVPRILADIIEDARRAVCGHCCADSPAWRGHFPAPDGLHLARFARARLRGLISEAPMAAMLAENGAWAWPILLACADARAPHRQALVPLARAPHYAWLLPQALARTLPAARVDRAVDPAWRAIPARQVPSVR
jgi:hypothetical protein